MGYSKLKLSNEDPPAMDGYSIIGWFKTFEDAEAWYKAARRAGKKYPFWCSRHPGSSLGEYHLWRKTPKGGGKMVGKGWA